ncbi:MAG: hypothetical protein U0Y82_09790 [Thermoleophilia bacterium]
MSHRGRLALSAAAAAVSAAVATTRCCWFSTATDAVAGLAPDGHGRAARGRIRACCRGGPVEWRPAGRGLHAGRRRGAGGGPVVTGYHVADGPGFARLTLSALRTDAGAQVVTDRVRPVLLRELQAAPDSAVDRTLVATILPGAVRDTLRSPEFGALAVGALTRIHDIAAHDRGTAVLDLNLVRDALAQRLRRTAPQLAALIPGSGAWGTVTLEPPAVARHHAQVAWAIRALRVAPWVCLGLAVLLGAAAVAGRRNRASALRMLGVGVLAAGAGLWAIAWVAPRVVGGLVSPATPDGALARHVVASLLDGITPVALVTACAGVALVLAARLS